MMKLSCNGSRKKLLLRVIPVILAIVLAFGTVGIAIASDAKEAWTGQITSEEQLTSLFPDAIFRKAVFDAVKDGQDNAKGATLEEALANFRGDITYSGKDKKDDEKIKSVQGMQYLRRVNTLNVPENEIKDLSFLERTVGGFITQEGKAYYGFTDAEVAADETILDREQGNNVFWDFNKNPLQNIPKNFGGRVVIKQMQRTSYTYAENFCDNIIFVRGNESDFSGTLDIGKLKIAGDRYIDLYSVDVQKVEGDDFVISGWKTETDDVATFEHLVKSGVRTIGCGTQQEIHYETSDEIGTITPGSISYKYYIMPKFYVYDKVDVTSKYSGSVVLTKTDDENNVVAGARYELYNKDGTNEGEYVTGADGKLIVTGLDAGSYYLKETQAPSGYVLDDSKIEFTLTSPTVTLGGGQNEVTDSNGTKHTAEKNSTFITGGTANAGENAYKPTDDITLTASEGASISKVTVTYESLDGTKTVRDTFKTVEEAQSDINAEKLANKITGAVHVEVEFGGIDGAQQVSHKNVKETTTEESTTETTEESTTAEETSNTDSTTTTSTAATTTLPNDTKNTTTKPSTGTTTKENSNAGSPKTGDSTVSVIVPAVVISIAGATILISINKRKKKQAQ